MLSPTRRRFVCAAALVCALCDLPAAETLATEQITFGPQHHLFGYIGQCRTIPWNASGRYLLALQVPFQDHMPAPEEAAEVCLLDTQAHYAVRVIDHSRAWNPQQGTMFYWNPELPETQFFFNDRDPATGHVFTVLYDVAQQRRVHEYKFDDTPVANGGVAQAGGYFLAINYGRLARLRPVTGYPGAFDWTKGVKAPADDGVFRVDVHTGEKKLLVSFRQMREALAGIDRKIEARELFINHTLNSRSGAVFSFYCRADFDDRKSRLNAFFTLSPNGENLVLQKGDFGGHPDWAEGTQLIGAIGEDDVLYDTATHKVVRALGGKDVFPEANGDKALSPDGRWLVNGGHVEGQNIQTFLELATGRVLRAEPLSYGPWGKGDLRLDPAPAWNRESNAILAPGLATDGTRQLFIICVPQNSLKR